VFQVEIDVSWKGKRQSAIYIRVCQIATMKYFHWTTISERRCFASVYVLHWYLIVYGMHSTVTTLIHILWIRHLFLSYALNNVMLLTVVMLNLQTDLAQHNLFTKTLHNWGSNYLNSSSGLFSIDPSDLLLQSPSNSAFTC
jgi:hypothetical protein